MGNQKGFTLIELIVSLVLLGVIGTLAGFGLTSAMEAYFFSRNNSEMVQQAQFGLNRIRLELIHMDGVTSAAPDTITYTNTTRNPGNTCTIARLGDQITFAVGGGAPSVLLDGIGTYPSGQDLFVYTANNGAAWDHTDDFATLYSVGVRLVLDRPDQLGGFQFQTTVNPRGNGARNAPKTIRHDK